MLKRILTKIAVENDVSAIAYIIACGSVCAAVNQARKIVKMTQDIFAQLSSYEKNLVLAGPDKVVAQTRHQYRHEVKDLVFPQGTRMSEIHKEFPTKTPGQIKKLQGVRDSLMFETQVEKAVFIKWLASVYMMPQDFLYYNEVRSLIASAPIPEYARARIRKELQQRQQFGYETTFMLRTPSVIADIIKQEVEKCGAEIAIEADMSA
jgi:hypothetical protein